MAFLLSRKIKARRLKIKALSITRIFFLIGLVILCVYILVTNPQGDLSQKLMRIQLSMIWGIGISSLFIKLLKDM